MQPAGKQNKSDWAKADAGQLAHYAAQLDDLFSAINIPIHSEKFEFTNILDE